MHTRQNNQFREVPPANLFYFSSHICERGDERLLLCRLALRGSRVGAAVISTRGPGLATHGIPWQNPSGVEEQVAHVGNGQVGDTRQACGESVLASNQLVA